MIREYTAVAPLEKEQWGHWGPKAGAGRTSVRIPISPRMCTKTIWFRHTGSGTCNLCECVAVPGLFGGGFWHTFGIDPAYRSHADR